jgi:hypothetical protein
VKRWLGEVEAILLSNRVPSAATVASLKAGLIAAQRGGAGPGAAGRGSRRAREAAAAETLARAEEVVAGAVRADAQRFADAARLMQQVVAVGERKGLLAGQGDATRSHALASTWRRLCADHDLAAVTTHAVSLAGPQDVLILLDRALPAPALPREATA